MIRIKPSLTADTRTCDYTKVTRDELFSSSLQHIADVEQGLRYFQRVLEKQLAIHDQDKLHNIEGFHRDFITGFQKTEWWDLHRKLNRHHLTHEDGVPEDVNLIDVLDFIVDCVMAGMARSGQVRPLKLQPELLERAFQNTVNQLISQVVVVKE